MNLLFLHSYSRTCGNEFHTQEFFLPYPEIPLPRPNCSPITIKDNLLFINPPLLLCPNLFIVFSRKDQPFLAIMAKESIHVHSSWYPENILG